MGYYAELEGREMSEHYFRPRGNSRMIPVVNEQYENSQYTRSQLTTHRGRLCNERAAIAKEIERLRLLHAAIDAGIQALEAQINAVVDKPPVS